MEFKQDLKEFPQVSFYPKCRFSIQRLMFDVTFNSLSKLIWSHCQFFTDKKEKNFKSSSYLFKNLLECLITFFQLNAEEFTLIIKIFA